MKTYYECIPCFLKQAQKALKGIDQRQHQTILEDVTKALKSIDYNSSPPEIARKIFDVIDTYTGGKDLYVDEKKLSNQYVLEMYDELKERIDSSSDRFQTSLKLAIAGNIIDFGAKYDFSDELIHKEISRVLQENISEDKMTELKNAIEQAENILYLGDNAGEIVFDKLFIEQLPKEKITFAVRGKPIINDAVMEDAEVVGMLGLAKVISNGSGIPGTVLHNCSEEFRTVFKNADLIISKGQGNYETLSTTEKDIFFLLKIKCDVVARDLNRDLGDFVIKRNV